MYEIRCMHVSVISYICMLMYKITETSEMYAHVWDNRDIYEITETCIHLRFSLIQANPRRVCPLSQVSTSNRPLNTQRDSQKRPLKGPLKKTLITRDARVNPVMCATKYINSKFRTQSISLVAHIVTLSHTHRHAAVVLSNKDPCWSWQCGAHSSFQGLRVFSCIRSFHVLGSFQVLRSCHVTWSFCVLRALCVLRAFTCWYGRCGAHSSFQGLRVFSCFQVCFHVLRSFRVLGSIHVLRAFTCWCGRCGHTRLFACIYEAVADCDHVDRR